MKFCTNAECDNGEVPIGPHGGSKPCSDCAVIECVALRADVKRWQKRTSDTLDELDAVEKKEAAMREALTRLWEWATTVACRSEIGDRYIGEARRLLGL